MQLDYRNAFNTLDREAMLAAVAERQPSLLPFVAWEYKQASRLIVRGAPEGTPPIMSQSGLRQGSVLAGLLFGLTTQGPLEALRLTIPRAPAVAVHDDTALQGRAADVIRAFHALRGLSAAIGLSVRLDKCGVFSRDAQAAEQTATALGIPHCVDGLVLAGTPVGTHAFVTAFAEKRADIICKAIDLMLEIPLPAQDQFLILRSSLQQRLVHLPRIAPWALVGAAVQRVERKTAQAAFSIMQRPEQDDVRDGQLTLAVRFGGIGIRVMSADEARAAMLSAAAYADTALRTGAQQFRTFAGPTGAEHTATWQELHPMGVEAELWPPNAVDVTDDCIDKLLPSVQRTFSRHVAQCKSDALRAACDTDTTPGLQKLARLLSCSCRAASLWLDTLPMCSALTLTSREVICAVRHRLGLTHMPANAVGVTCWCGQHMEADNPDHAMTCRSLSGAVTLRHDILKEIWRRIANRAGIATSVEPVMRPLRGSQAAAIANRPESRGDILLVLDSALTVADVSVVHPCAITYMRAGAREEGGAAAVRDAAKRAQYATADPNGYAFTPLSTESFGRLGKPAMKLLSKLAETAGAGGVRPKDGFVAHALRELSIGLCKGNAVLYKRSMYALARASGNEFRAGMDYPTAQVA